MYQYFYKYKAGKHKVFEQYDNAVAASGAIPKMWHIPFDQLTMPPSRSPTQMFAAASLGPNPCHTPLCVSPEQFREEEMRSLLNKHDGEARAWQLHEEVWFRLDNVPDPNAATGAYMAEFMLTPDDDFPLAYTSVECAPDFARGISLIACKDARQGVCVRRVAAITLPEVLAAYGGQFSLRRLLETWLEGALVRRFRGCQANRGDVFPFSLALLSPLPSLSSPPHPPSLSLLSSLSHSPLSSLVRH